MSKTKNLIEKLLNEGGQFFINFGKGSNIKAAFRDAINNARDEYGNRGYTGSVAEKDDYIEIELPPEIDINNRRALMYWIYDAKMDSHFMDKWGPAGAVKVGRNKWAFFGMASS